MELPGQMCSVGSQHWLSLADLWVWGWGQVFQTQRPPGCPALGGTCLMNLVGGGRNAVISSQWGCDKYFFKFSGPLSRSLCCWWMHHLPFRAGWNRRPRVGAKGDDVFSPYSLESQGTQTCTFLSALPGYGLESLQGVNQ